VVLFKYSARLRGKGLSFDESLVLVVTAAKAARPPLAASEALRALQSAYGRYPAGEDLEWSADGAGDGFRFIKGDEIETLPKPDWLIDDVIAEGSLTVLVGPSGHGKTFLGLSMAGCIAAGMDWLGRATKQGKVIFVAAEGSGDLGKRVAAFRRANGLETLPDVWYLIEPVNLYEGDTDLLAVQLRDEHPALIVIDTLARSMAGGDENFARDMNQVIGAADRLRHSTGATVLIVHHTGHDNKRERGSSALRAASDTFMLLKIENGLRTLTCMKQKMAPRFRSAQIDLQPVGESLALVSGPMTPILTTNQQVGATLVPPDGITQSAWKKGFTKETGKSETTFHRVRKALVDKGIVTKDGDGKGALYRLTDHGNEQMGVTGAK
jgi:hypothetical protein